MVLLVRDSSGAAKANENVCGDGIYFDGERNALRVDPVYDTDSFSPFASSPLSQGSGGISVALGYRV